VLERTYTFGEMLVKYNVDLGYKLDSKATTIAGYIGAMLVFLIGLLELASQCARFNPSAALRDGIGIAFAAIGGISALAGLWIQTYNWYTDSNGSKIEAACSREASGSFGIMCGHFIGSMIATPQ